MDMAAQKAKRDERIQAKKERIKNELNAPAESGSAEAEAASIPQAEETPQIKQAKPQENIVAKKVDKPRESK